jgi:hypothetical protein
VTRPPFTMVPRAFLDSFDESSDNEIRVGAALCRWADYKSGEWSGTLEQLERLSAWRKDRRTLLRTLESLRAKGWVGYEVSARQRKPWLIRLTGLSVACDIESPSGVAVVSQPSATDSATATATQTATSTADLPTADAEARRTHAAVEQRQEVGVELQTHQRQEVAPSPSTSLSMRDEDHFVGEGTHGSEAPDELTRALFERTGLTDIERARRFDTEFPPRRRDAA